MSVFVFVKYILTLVLPFFIAFCLVSGLQPILRKLEELLHIRKRVIAVILLTAISLLAGAIIWYVGAGFLAQIGDFSRNMKGYGDSLEGFVRSCCQRLEQYVGMDAVDMEDAIFLYVDNFTTEIKSKALPKLMDKSVFYVRIAVTAAGFLAITLIATVLLAKDFHKIQADLRKYSWFLTAEDVGREIGRLSVDYLKAQIMILSVVGGISAVMLWLIGVNYGVVIGLLTGLMDALPFIGTGCVLVPVALWQLIQGNIWQCVAILLLYVGCIILREFLEPKLIGKQMDIYPIVVLLTIYVGIGIYGLAGVVLGPLSLLLVREIWRKIPDFGGDD